MEIKKVHEDFANNPEAFMIVDRRGLLHRKLATRYEGTANFNAVSQANELGTYFRDAWQHGIAYTDFRRRGKNMICHEQQSFSKSFKN